MTIGMKYMSARLSIIIGSVMVSLSYILTAYAEHIGILYFTVGFIQGEYCMKDHRSENDEKLRNSKGDYWNKQRFSSIASLFKMGTSLKGKNLLLEVANSFFYEQFLIVWKITITATIIR